MQGDTWRISVLAEGLVRLEWAADGAFEDRASTFAIHRDLPVPEFEVIDRPAAVEVVTARLHVVYDRGPFTAAGLSVAVRPSVSNHGNVWRYGEPADDLGGTARTLDEIDGRAELEPGIVSRHGLGALDDSASFVFDDDGWVAPARRRPRRHLRLRLRARLRRRAPGVLRGLGQAVGAAALDAGQLVEPLPRLQRGLATSRCWTASTPRGCRSRSPCWTWTGTASESVPEQYGTGWTGYSWEPELFPDPEGFLAELHRRGLRVTLNVHPADGVQPFEDAYADMARELGRDPDAGEPIAFDVTDPEFLAAYFEVLHHRLEDQGVDFWWLDWQQGGHSRTAGIDPLWMLNHFHFLDSGREDRRPLTFSRYAGPGSHRYPIGFSGDHHISWESLDFQPEFTATASNIGYGWWSHDIGGHIFGARDDELTARWVQYGVFSPILRLHSSSNPFLVKEPWLYPREAARRDDRGAALPPPARALPAHDEPPRRRRGRAAGAADVPPRARRASARTPCPTSTRSAPSCSSRRSRRPRDPVTLRGAVARVAAARRLDRHLHVDGLRRRPRDRAAPRRQLDPRAPARRRHPAAGGRGRPRRHAQPGAARAARRARRPTASSR